MTAKQHDFRKVERGMSNLPPGVTASMIPGNTPENEWSEQLFLDLAGAVQAFCDKVPGLNREDLTWALRQLADEAEADPDYFRYQPHPLAVKVRGAQPRD